MPKGNGKGPERVALVALGPTSVGYLPMAEALGDRRQQYDQVWVVNSFASVLRADLIFHMDDMRIQEIRARADPGGKVACMLESFKTMDTPIMTSRLYPEYPSSVEYPLEDVLNSVPYGYFTTTPPYALAYALHLGVKELSIFGMDYDWPGAKSVEAGKSCFEFWMGVVLAKGMGVHMSIGTTILGEQLSEKDRYYGYDTREVHTYVDDTGRTKVTFKEVKDLPSADAIEAKYGSKVGEEVEQSLHE